MTTVNNRKEISGTLLGRKNSCQFLKYSWEARGACLGQVTRGWTSLSCSEGLIHDFELSNQAQGSVSPGSQLEIDRYPTVKSLGFQPQGASVGLEAAVLLLGWQ
jgi:hypothetical protein